MDTQIKKQKLCYDNTPKSISTLSDICNWNHLDNIAIEYHDLKKSFIVTYLELNDVKLKIQTLLRCIQNFQFIGINCDISTLCIPSLMLGVVASNHGFIYLPKESSLRSLVFAELKIEYLFIHQSIPDVKILKQFNIHGESIYLAKYVQNDTNKKDNEELNCYAYAITTSASTGIPKIVKVLHSCILPNIQDFKKILNVSEVDKIAQLTNFTFDPSIIEIFLTFSCAGTLLAVSKNIRNDPIRLAETISLNNVTILQLTPSVFFQTWSIETIKLRLLGKESHLRVLLLGGEPFPKLELIFKVKDRYNTTKVFNVYGITEVSCWSSINEITSNTVDPYDLGEPLSETMFEVRDKSGTVIHIGEGSLFIGSNTRICAIMKEQINNLEKPVFRDTGDIVVINDIGKVFYKHRKSRIIKRFGNKVDLQRLDKTVSNINYIQMSYSIWNEKDHKLHLFVNTTDKMINEENVTKEIMNHLSEVSPLYKPDKVHILQSFTLTENGKVCTRFLKDLCIECKNDDRKTEKISLEGVREIFSEIWTNYLKHIDKGFLQLGGTSVVALQISTSLTDISEIEFPGLIGMLLKDSNFEECLSYIEAKLISTAYADNIISPVPNNQANIRNLNIKMNATLVNDEKIYTWQKCRGKTYPDLKNYDISLTNKISSINIERSYNLNKCVDASPTIFKYSNEKSYAVVGSHSGIIYMIGLDEMSNVEYKVDLPDRIEASVLMLNNFVGIVGCYDGFVYCLNLKTGQIIWKFKTGDIVKCTAVICEVENVYFGSYDRHAYCISSKDGSEIWKVKVSNGSICASGCLHDQSGSVLFGTLDGFCAALQRTTGKIIWKRQLTDPIFVTPAILYDNLILFCTVAGNLCCFDIATDQKMWSYNIDGNIFAYPLVRYDPIAQNKFIILASKNKNLYYLQLKDPTGRNEPTVKYIINCESPIFSTPSYQGNVIIVGCTNGKLICYDLSTNESLVSIKLPGDVFSSPIIYNTNIIVGCRDNKLYVLKLC